MTSRSELQIIRLRTLLELTVRPLGVRHFERFINYWQRLSPAEITAMGVAVSRMPSTTRMRSDLKRMVTARHNGVNAFVLAWCVNGEAIGHSSLKDIVTGDSGSIHLHMWRTDLRGKGYGSHLFCLAVIDFYERFELRRMIFANRKRTISRRIDCSNE